MRELRALLALAGPLILTQLGLMTLGVVDAMLAARLSVRALNAVTLGNLFQTATALPLYGVVLGLDPLVSQAHGAGRGDDAGRALQRGLAIAFALSLPTMLSWAYAEQALVWLGQDPALSRAAQVYTNAQLFSVPAWLSYAALSVYLSARGIVRPGVFVMLAANLENALVAWALIFGKLGLPALGLYGAGLATGLTRVVIAVALLALTFGLGLHRGAWAPWSYSVLEWRALVRQLGLGMSVGVTLSLELWAFQIGTLIAGRLDTVSLGAHAVVLSAASLAFMVPLGIAYGASARVGNLIGAGDLRGAQHAAEVSLKLAGAVALGSALTFALGRVVIPGLYSPDAEVVKAAARVMPIAGAFQLMDALQAVSGGILRGMGRPKVTATVNLVGYFALGIPLAYYLALHTALELRGVWLGYAVGLAFVATGLVVFVLLRGPKTVKALAV